MARRWKAGCRPTRQTVAAALSQRGPGDAAEGFFRSHRPGKGVSKTLQAAVAVTLLLGACGGEDKTDDSGRANEGSLAPTGSIEFGETDVSSIDTDDPELLENAVPCPEVGETTPVDLEEHGCVHDGAFVPVAAMSCPDGRRLIVAIDVGFGYEGEELLSWQTFGDPGSPRC